VLPPLLATIGKGLARKLSVTDLIHALKQARDLRVYLAGTRPDEAAAERERRVRDLYDTLLARLDLDVPPEATQPIVDHLVTKVLAEWDAEAASTAPPGPPGPPSPTKRDATPGVTWRARRLLITKCLGHAHQQGVRTPNGLQKLPCRAVPPITSGVSRCQALPKAIDHPSITQASTVDTKEAPI
jgi:hypothetical protein